MLIWLMCNLTAQEMREQILDSNSEWKQHVISWLETCHIGEFMTGTQVEVLNKVAEQAKSDSYRDPTETLPEPPPKLCKLIHAYADECNKCSEWNKWWDHFENTVDDIVSRSNIHNCERGTNKAGSGSKKYASCKDNRYGECNACFP